MEGGHQEGEARAAYSTNKPHVVCSRLVQTDLNGSSRNGCVSIPPPILQLNYLKYDLVDRSSLNFLESLFHRKLSGGYQPELT